MFPCRGDYIITLFREARRFGPLGPTPLRDSRYTFRPISRLGSVLSGLEFHRIHLVLNAQLSRRYYFSTNVPLPSLSYLWSVIGLASP